MEGEFSSFLTILFAAQIKEAYILLQIGKCATVYLIS